MKTYRITITPLSYLASASGSNGPLIDIDVLYDPNTGLPYLNGKRIKGLLRESAREVLEIKGENDKVDPWINTYFGVADSLRSQSKISHAGNFKLQDSQTISEFLKRTKEKAFTSDRVLNLFTSEKTVTAVDDDGIAKDKSLRVYRLVKPSTSDLKIVFEGNFDIDFKNEDDEKVFTCACKNLRFMGTSRNTGLGKIKVECSELKEELSNSQESNIKQNTINLDKGDALHVKLTTVSPVVISKSTDDPNTMNSNDSIDGSSIRGMIANKYIKCTKLKYKTAHENSDFYDIFLSGKVSFGALNINNAHRMSYHIQKYKAHESKTFKDVFSSKIDNGVSKTYGKRGTLKSKAYNVYDIQKQMSFHNSRLERSAGKSTEAHPGIYYYESISAGQSFEGRISGDSRLINKLVATIGNTLEAKLGKSKSVQYSSVALQLDKLPNTTYTETEANAEDRYLIKILSPVVLENNCGIATPNVDLLKAELEDENLTIINASCRTVPVEHYNTMWAGRSAKVLAYDEGSVFLVQGLAHKKTGEYHLGAMTSLGYGKVSIEKYDENDCPDNENGDDNGNEVKSNEEKIEVPPNPILKKLKSTYDAEEMDNTIHLEALENTKLIKGLSRSQITRLSSLLQSSTSKEVWLAYFDKQGNRNGLSNQEIGSKMKRLFIFEEIKGLQMPRTLKTKVGEQNEHFENAKKYFLYLFTSALKQPKDKQNDKL